MPSVSSFKAVPKCNTSFKLLVYEPSNKIPALMPRSTAACYMKVFYKGMKFVSFATWDFDK
jgi:hypothetical protein